MELTSSTAAVRLDPEGGGRIASLDLDGLWPFGGWVEQRVEVSCVEPQSDAPDAFNRNPMILEAGETLDVWMRISWELE